MILLRFTTNSNEYITTFQTASDANKHVSNIAKSLRKHHKLESLEKINDGYICRLANGNSVKIYLLQSSNASYLLQLFDGDKLVKSYELKTLMML